MIYALDSRALTASDSGSFSEAAPPSSGGSVPWLPESDGDAPASSPASGTELTPGFEQLQVRPVKVGLVCLDRSIKDILSFSADVHKGFNRGKWDLSQGNCLVCWELCRCEIISCKMRDEAGSNTWY